MKLNFNFLSIISFIKKSPEKLISYFFLTAFILLGSYLAINWFGRRAIFPLEKIVNERMPGEPVVKAAVFVDFEDFLIRKPLTYYHDLIRRNPFVRLPGVVGDDGVIIFGQEVRLIYRGHILTPEGPVAFIEGRETHMVREGDEIEGWRIIKIDREEMKVYNEQEGRELFLPLGGGPEEEERLRRRREERRERVQEHRPERPPLEHLERRLPEHPERRLEEKFPEFLFKPEDW